MSQINDSRIIAPPIEEEVYPYRKVWRSIILQTGIMIAVATTIIILGQLFVIQLSGTITLIISSIFVLVPVMLWLLFSVLPENFVQEPRSRLITAAIVSGLVASAIGIPLAEDFFQLDRWLPLESALQRILGFTFTVGIVDTGLKFIIVRYMFFPHKIRIRTDLIAYCVASAIGYSFVINLHLITDIQPLYSTAMIYIFSNYTIQIASGIFVAYGLSETYFTDAIPILLPVSLIVAALVIGIISPLVSGLMNGSLTLDGSTDQPIFSLGFLIVMLVASLGMIFFLYGVAERREREAFADSD